MKKLVAFLFIVTLISNSGFAQNTEQTFGKGTNVIGAGFGVGGVYGYNSFSSQTPVFGLQYDRGIVPLKFGAVIGVGGFVGYKGYAYKSGGYKENINIVIIGARGTFHYDLFEVENLDTYGGVMIAFHAVSSNDNVPANYGYYGRKHSSAAYSSIYAGAKYYFTPGFGAFAEVGYGVSWLTVGAAFKF